MDAGAESGDTIGMRVRRVRRTRGMTLEQVAGQAGKTKAWLSKIENGHLPLEKRSDIAALAIALDVAADTLLGQPAPEIRRPNHPEYSVTSLRAVLQDAGPGNPPDIPARPVPVLRDLIVQLDAALRRDDYVTIHQHLASVISELLVHTASPDGGLRNQALRQIILAVSVARTTLRHFGRTDLAWIAADRGVQAAAMLGEPAWIGAAAYGMSDAVHAANMPRALLETPQSADALLPHVGDDVFAAQAYGMLRLSAALARTLDGDYAGARDQAADAAEVAARLGDREDAWSVFGPSNVGVWGVFLANEAGNAESALTLAAQVLPASLPSTYRRASLQLETGRALVMTGKPVAAAVALRRAEQISGEQVRNNPVARELVTHLLSRARREAGGSDLRGLAWRMGVV